MTGYTYKFVRFEKKTSLIVTTCPRPVVFFFSLKNSRVDNWLYIYYIMMSPEKKRFVTALNESALFVRCSIVYAHI